MEGIKWWGSGREQFYCLTSLEPGVKEQVPTLQLRACVCMGRVRDSLAHCVFPVATADI